MINFLNTPAVEMVPAAQEQSRAEQLEVAAKKMGFPSYEAYRLWTAQRERKHDGTVAGAGTAGNPGTPAPQQTAAPPPTHNLSSIFSYIQQKMAGQ